MLMRLEEQRLEHVDVEIIKVGLMDTNKKQIVGVVTSSKMDKSITVLGLE